MCNLKYILMTAIFAIAMMSIYLMPLSAEDITWADYEVKCWINNEIPSYEEYEDISAGTDYMYDEETNTLSLFQED